MPLIRCENIKKYFHGRTGPVMALDGVSLEIEKGSVFGLVGESGCGKTTLGKIILGILNPDSGRVVPGTDRLQVIFQDPHNSLDPKMKIYDILSEGLLIGGHKDVMGRVEKTLDLVRLPRTAMGKYPHQFSGGERQRIAIGRAVITDPGFIVCDEPVSSLDVTIQLEILNLLKDIRKEFGMTYLFISHDLRVIKYICDRVAVMREGRIVEEGSVKQIYSNPSDLYTRNLLASVTQVC